MIANKAGKKEELKGIVGKDNVLDEKENLEAYSQDQSFIRPMKPWFVVRPMNVDGVEELVKWANETQTPLIPVSSGAPHFHGDTVPSVAGAVVVDLSGMNRIIRVDRRNRMVLIEPGVTYSQIQPELAKEGLRLTTPLLPRANKSVVASLLERQPTQVPKYNWSLPEPLRSLEVVWGYGKKMRTGEAGAKPGSLEDQWEKKLAQVGSAGPGSTDFHRLLSGSQGTMGIVTWASVKCEILPKVHKLLFIPARKLEDLIDFTYRILKIRFGDELFLLNGSNLAYILGEGADNIQALKQELPPWVAIVGIAGRDILPEKRVAYQEKDIRDIAQQFGLHPVSVIPGATDLKVLQAVLNASKEPYWKLAYRGGCQDIFFLNTLDKTPLFLKTMYSMAEASNYPCSDIGIHIQPQHQGTVCNCEFHLPFDPTDSGEIARTLQLFSDASETLIKQGAYFSRPYGIWADMVYSRDAKSTMYLRKIKEIFDPNNILNPGKLCF